MKMRQFYCAGGAVAVLATALFLAGCRSPSFPTALQRYEFKSPHMGTLFSLTLFAPNRATATNAAAAAFERIAALERAMTDYDPDSELMRLCQQPVGVPVRVSNDLFDVLAKAQQVAQLSDGAFDATIGPYVRLWRRARRTQALPSAELLAAAAEPVGYRKLRLDARNKTVTLTVPKMQLDLGGIAKGYAADNALRVMKSKGITRALVAASGDIAVSDPPPGKRGWRIGIGAADAPGTNLAETILLRNAAISTSGDTEQFVEINGKRYSHIVNPKTRIGLTESIQVSIVGKNAAATDSFATAVSVLGVKRGLALVKSQPDMAALILRRTNEQNEVFTSRSFGRIPRALDSAAGTEVQSSDSQAKVR